MHLKAAVLLLALVPAMALAEPAATAPNPPTYKQFQPRIKKKAETTLPYQLMVPNDYDPKNPKSLPLIVWLHGSGEKGGDNLAQIKGLDNTFLGNPKTPAFVMVPQCPKDVAWHATGINKAPDVPESSKLLIEAIADVQKEFGIDDRRIYIGGFSMGAVGTWELIMRYPQLFAAAFPISGTPVHGPDYPAQIKHLPIWAFHGDKDAYSPIDLMRKTDTALKALKSPLKYTEYKGGTHEFSTAIKEPDLLPWLFAKKRTASPEYTQAKVPDTATSITKAMEAGTRGTWTGPVSKTGHGRPRIEIDKIRYSLKPAPNTPPALAETIAKIAKGELTGTYEVTGTVELDKIAWIAVEKITAKK
jgi:predicted esterase